jgi:hypothetical protein
MIKPIVIIAFCLIAIGCGSDKPEAPKSDASPPKSYFPISEYVQGQIMTVDSLPVGILKKFTSGKTKDSAFIGHNEFHQLASDFTGQDLTKENLEKNYTEHSFMDESTGFFTFTYQPLKTDAPFQRIDVLVKPGANSDKVRSIYLERSRKINDTVVNERLYWKSDASFSITKEKIYKEQTPIIQQLQVIWDTSAY